MNILKYIIGLFGGKNRVIVGYVKKEYYVAYTPKYGYIRKILTPRPNVQPAPQKLKIIL
jgi:hypothetical protein